MGAQLGFRTSREKCHWRPLREVLAMSLESRNSWELLVVVFNG